MKARVTTTDDGMVSVLVPREDGGVHSLTLTPDQAFAYARAVLHAEFAARGGTMTSGHFAKSRTWRL